MARQNQISYTEPSQPSFIRAFKQKTGYQEGPKLSDKFKPNSDDENSEDEIDPKSELLEMINNNQLSVANSASCDLSKEDLRDIIQGKDLAAIAAAKEKEKNELALREAKKLTYDEERDGKIIYRAPPPSAKHKRRSEADKLESESKDNNNKRKKEREVNTRLLTCIPSDEEGSASDKD